MATRTAEAAASIQSNKTQPILNTSQVPTGHHQQPLAIRGDHIAMAMRKGLNAARGAPPQDAQGVNHILPMIEATDTGRDRGIIIAVIIVVMRLNNLTRRSIVAEAEATTKNIIVMKKGKEVTQEVEREGETPTHPQGHHQGIASTRKIRRKAIRKRVGGH